MELNLHTLLEHDKLARAEFTGTFTTWNETRAKYSDSRSVDELNDQLFLPENRFDLCAYLAVPYHRLCYRHVWRLPNFLHAVLQLWWIARLFDHKQCAIIRAKVFKFLRTGYTLSGPIIPIRMWHFKVPAVQKTSIIHLRTVFRSILCKIGRLYCPLARVFFASRIRITQSAPIRFSDLFDDHFVLSSKFTEDAVKEIPAEQVPHLAAREDIRWRPMHWNFPIGDSPVELNALFKNTLHEFLQTSGLSSIQDFNAFSSIDFLPLLQPKHGQQPACESWMDFATELRKADPDCAYIPLDKDNNRRCDMRKDGYNLRMWKNYACGRPFYA